MFKINILLSLICLTFLSMSAADDEHPAGSTSFSHVVGPFSISWSGALPDSGPSKATKEIREVDISSVDFSSASDDQIKKMMFDLGIGYCWRGEDTIEYKSKWFGEGRQKDIDMILQEVKKRCKKDEASPFVPAILSNGSFDWVQPLVTSFPEYVYEQEFPDGCYYSGSVLHHLLDNSSLGVAQKIQLITVLGAKYPGLLMRENSEGKLPFEKMLEKLLWSGSMDEGEHSVLKLLHPGECDFPLQGDASLDACVELERRKYALGHSGMPIELAETDGKDMLSIMQEVVELAEDDYQYAERIFLYMCSSLYPRKDEFSSDIMVSSLLYALDFAQASNINKLGLMIEELVNVLVLDKRVSLFDPIETGDEVRVPMLQMWKKACELNDDYFWYVVGGQLPRFYMLGSPINVGDYVKEKIDKVEIDGPQRFQWSLLTLNTKIKTKFKVTQNPAKTKEELLEQIKSLSEVVLPTKADELERQYQLLQEHIENCYQKRAHQDAILHEMVQFFEDTYGSMNLCQLPICGPWLDGVIKFLLKGGRDQEQDKKLALHLCLKPERAHYIEAHQKFDQCSKLEQIYLRMKQRKLVKEIASALAMADFDLESMASRRSEKDGDCFKPSKITYFDLETWTIKEREWVGYEDLQKCLQSYKKAFDQFSPEAQKAVTMVLESKRDELTVAWEELELPSAGGGASSSSSSSGCSSSSAAE